MIVKLQSVTRNLISTLLTTLAFLGGGILVLGLTGYFEGVGPLDGVDNGSLVEGYVLTTKDVANLRWIELSLIRLPIIFALIWALTFTLVTARDFERNTRDVNKVAFTPTKTAYKSQARGNYNSMTIKRK